MSEEYEVEGLEGLPDPPARVPADYGPQSSAADQVKRKPSYFGSVRFFKHMILVVLALLIFIPASLAVAFALRSNELDFTVKQLKKNMDGQAELLITQQQQLQELASQPVAEFSGEPLDSLPATSAPTWQSLYPELYAQETARSSVDDEGTVYLTFDDGPSEQTSRILEVLARYNVKATFFVVGKSDAQSRQRLQEIVNAGHTIGIHSYSQEMADIYGSVEQYLNDFKQIYDLIAETTGVAPQVFRFPGGSVNGYNAATYQEIISEMVRRGFVYFDWNIMTGDAIKGDGPAVEALVSNALKDASYYRRIVLLMHDLDDKPNTVEALPQIIEGYLNAGFTLAPLTAQVKPVVFSYPN